MFKVPEGATIQILPHESKPMFFEKGQEPFPPTGDEDCPFSNWPIKKFYYLNGSTPEGEHRMMKLSEEGLHAIYEMVRIMDRLDRQRKAVKRFKSSVLRFRGTKTNMLNHH